MISKSQIKQIQALHLKKNRDTLNLFVVEGVKAVTELLDFKPAIVKEVFATFDFVAKNKILIGKLKIKCNEISEVDLKKISLQQNPNEVLAVCSFLTEEQESFNFDAHFSLYLDDIRDPGNFGTMIRLADWYGISTVFCSKNCCELYNPKVIQSTMGAFLRVSVVYIDLASLIKTHNIKNIYGAVLKGENIYEQELKNGIVIIGNEANGISDENMRLISQSLTIPSPHQNGSESLNAAMAASIIVSEFFRQLNYSA